MKSTLHRILLIIVGLLISNNQYSQRIQESKYVFIQVYSDKHFKVEDPTYQEVKFLNSKKNFEFDEVEKGMFKAKSSFNFEYVGILIGEKVIKLNLKRYKKNKFFSIKVFIPPSKIENQNIIKAKRGDTISIVDNCGGESCDIILIEFPQIITINGDIRITGNQKFEKYIFQ